MLALTLVLLPSKKAQSFLLLLVWWCVCVLTGQRGLISKSFSYLPFTFHHPPASVFRIHDDTQSEKTEITCKLVITVSNTKEKTFRKLSLFELHQLLGHLLLISSHPHFISCVLCVCVCDGNLIRILMNNLIKLPALLLPFPLIIWYFPTPPVYFFANKIKLIFKKFIIISARPTRSKIIWLWNLIWFRHKKSPSFII